jgi:hypothetical protein
MKSQNSKLCASIAGGICRERSEVIYQLAERDGPEGASYMTWHPKTLLDEPAVAPNYFPQ